MKTTFSKEEAVEVAEKIGINWDNSPFDLEQFRSGMDIELEHGTIDESTNVTNDDPVMTGKIALAHLHEIADYYDRLEEMEKAAGS
ncbi:hypothetical protein KJ641_01655 [Patescibacteria group bacterium]|nr:hypothetical protein [Patescibacteria group bacterium]MBU1895556.1 hypothetical protein [Patescibacteria group bacterium]